MNVRIVGENVMEIYTAKTLLVATLVVVIVGTRICF